MKHTQRKSWFVDVHLVSLSDTDTTSEHENGNSIDKNSERRNPYLEILPYYLHDEGNENMEASGKNNSWNKFRFLMLKFSTSAPEKNIEV